MIQENFCEKYKPQWNMSITEEARSSLPRSFARPKSPERKRQFQDRLSKTAS